ncbi:protein draper isoform X6 [Condylostylus longicornis]|uniref:protein draper isoform X6 n=1 Tax=Condylostylus longicornis TaxID=2530218 RepID=UPI00244DA31F|nr:protein draper isoform X6 [Condylostylus longicornis]
MREIKMEQNILVNLIYIFCIFTVISTTFVASQTVEYEDLDGPHVCKKVEKYNVEVITTEKQSYQERVNVWCFSFPPRCSSYKLKQRTVNKTQILEKTRVVKVCCDGYIKEKSQCVPYCSVKCQFGKCVAPEVCKCEHGYGGPACDISVNCETQCAPGYYGNKCELECNCLNNSSCDSVTGDCVCARGWTGINCSEPCPKGFFGTGCREVCQPIGHGEENKTCDHITGKYVCLPGYIGMTCEHPCPEGRYGQDCSKKCNCEHGGECNHITGDCQCRPGWSGRNCNESCPDDMYGPNCAQRCRCQHSKQCRKNDGHCICLPGWMGTTCDEVCPEGFYGLHCMELCNCPNENFVCHAAQGCVCRQGYTGSNCDVLISLHRIEESSDSTKAGLAWGVAIVILLIAVILAVLLYYRRRVSNLKTEIAHVQYITEAQLYPERNHNFDNPVYGFQGQDNTRLLNNLKQNGKMNNLNVTDPEYNGDNSNANGKAGSYSLNYNSETCMKNLHADMTNPNVYHCIDKEEHVYDEIKHKEGYKDPVKDFQKNIFPNNDEYDHLDYSRPSSSFKPHYHQMNDTILNLNTTTEEKPSNLAQKPLNVLLATTEEDDDLDSNSNLKPSLNNAVTDSDNSSTSETTRINK